MNLFEPKVWKGWLFSNHKQAFWFLTLAIIQIYFLNNKEFIYFVISMIFLIIFLTIGRKNLKATIGCYVIPIIAFLIWTNLIATKNHFEFLVNATGTILEIKTNYLIIKIDHTYYYLSNSSSHTYYLNQKIIINGRSSLVDDPINYYNFNFKGYLKNHFIYYQINDFTIKSLNNFSFKSTCNNLLTKAFGQNAIGKTFFLFDKDNDFYQQLNSMSISYLLNGIWYLLVFNLSLLIAKIKNQKNQAIIFYSLITLLIFYSYATNYPIILIRIICGFAFKKIAKLAHYQIDKFDTLLIFVLVYCWFDPLFFTDSFFWYLLIANIFLVREKQKSFFWFDKIKDKLYLFIKLALAFLPIQIYFDYGYNFGIEIQKFILTPLVALEICFSAFTSLFHLTNFSHDLEMIWYYLQTILKHITYYYYFGHQLLFGILFVYLSMFMIKDRQIAFFLIPIAFFGLILGFEWLIKLDETLTVLNVGNGQSIVYQNKWTNVTIMFDCGVGKGRGPNDDVDYLKYLGINKINDIFISHEHDDHKNALDLITKTFKVNNIFHRFDGNDLITERGITIHRFRSFLDSSDENDNCSAFVVLTKYNNFLITGDITNKVENNLLNNLEFIFLIKNHPISLMEIAHHGSSTSSSETFLTFINPKKAFISCERKGAENFPTNQTVATLNRLHIKWISTQAINNLCFNLKNLSCTIK